MSHPPCSVCVWQSCNSHVTLTGWILHSWHDHGWCWFSTFLSITPSLVCSLKPMSVDHTDVTMISFYSIYFSTRGLNLYWLDKGKQQSFTSRRSQDKVQVINLSDRGPSRDSSFFNYNWLPVLLPCNTVVSVLIFAVLQTQRSSRKTIIY